ncbi:ABC transporter substrate-binding protein [Rhizobiales bacterium]|uniref:extracellular solute-binding protein n=1 Tax=Hongsoonwoonella zoysiae TaxID=2821844 RepID=UPI0015604227|nr:extracellular solute-binding protein [Hongsoonwoonella zoysiae]NRG18829.1 ABC transporter substrate-binding protein [Hongsoonwoonella zoysiae]
MVRLIALPQRPPLKTLSLAFALALSAVAFVASPALSQDVPAAHGIAMHGKPALPADFASFPYADPNAPKGGRVTYGVQGSFDSLNQFVVQGGTSSARGIRDSRFGALVIESLLARNHDEPFSLYGLLAESVRLPETREWIEFTLNPNAKFSDGKPVTVEDVVFSFKVLREKGRPHFRARYERIKSIEKTGPLSVRFTFENGNDRELPLLLGLSPIFASHTIDPDTFDKSTLVPPIGSGPYVIESVEPGTQITYRRNQNYWGKDVPAQQGLYNFDAVKVEYYRDENALQQAFQKGLVTVLPISDPARWKTGFDFPAAQRGDVVRDVFELETPAGMYGFVFNTRRRLFADKQVRKALAMLFDFEWVNRNLYYGLYRRTAGYFDNSILSSIGQPASEIERSFLKPFQGQIEQEVMEGEWRPTEADGSGRDRTVLREAVGLLQKAGYNIRKGVMQDRDAKPLEFEILVASKDQERLALAYQRLLKLLGINTIIRTVDAAQYQQRRQVFDYDMVLNFWPSSLSPGNEQNYRWSSEAANTDGSFNFAGVESDAVDAMIDALLAARTQEEFVAAVRAFDRTLISGHYVVPLFHVSEEWIARWNTVEHPDRASVAGARLEAWWSSTAVEANAGN